MKKFAFKTLALSALSLSIFTASAFEARVVGVTDGDTNTVLDDQKSQHKIRVAGIDAPEKNQDFGHRSKEHLSDLVFGKTVIYLNSDWPGTKPFLGSIGRVNSNK